MEDKEIKDIVETLLFITDMPLTIEKISEIIEQPAKKIQETISEIMKDYEERNSPIQLREIAGGYQFSTKPEYAKYIQKLFKHDTTLKLSQAALETLSIIAYKQPTTRAQIEEIRGVDSSGVLETLLEKKLIRVLGRKETLGRPLIYGTTIEFMRYLGLKSLDELPPLEQEAKSINT